MNRERLTATSPTHACFIVKLSSESMQTVKRSTDDRTITMLPALHNSVWANDETAVSETLLPEPDGPPCRYGDRDDRRAFPGAGSIPHQHGICLGTGAFRCVLRDGGGIGPRFQIEAGSGHLYFGRCGVSVRSSADRHPESERSRHRRSDQCGRRVARSDPGNTRFSAGAAL